MTLVVLAGIGVGLGLIGLVSGARPARLSAKSVLHALDRSVVLARMVSEPRTEPRAIGLPHRRLGARLARDLDKRGLLPPRLVALARATQTTVEDVCAEMVLGCVTGLVLPVAISAILSLGGLSIPFVVPVWATLVLGVAGAALPLLVVQRVARHTRRSARVVIAAYLDLVVLHLAGGMGIESALHSAATVAHDEFSARILKGLEFARDAGETPWQALADLGEDLGVTELVELAAAVRLAGTEGARIRSTLAVKAVSIRRHELADAESEANTVTERLFLPGVLLLVGFLLFVGYPAVARITGGF